MHVLDKVAPSLLPLLHPHSKAVSVGKQKGHAYLNTWKQPLRQPAKPAPGAISELSTRVLCPSELLRRTSPNQPPALLGLYSLYIGKFTQYSLQLQQATFYCDHICKGHGGFQLFPWNFY